LSPRASLLHTGPMDSVSSRLGALGAGVAVAAALTGLSLATLAETAEGVAGSGMRQGDGAITTRSDVEMAVESLKGTSRARLGAVGKAVGGKLSAIRGCYAKVASKRPTKEGALRIEVRVPDAGKRVKVQVAVDEVGDGELTSCVVGAIKSADYSDVRGAAGGLVVVDFANTAARGARIVAEERDQAPSKVVSRTEDGRPRISARTEGGEVEVTITGEGDTSAAAVVALNQAIQSRIGTLLDARRRASRREMNPAGETVIAFTVGRRGAASGRRVSSNLEDSTAYRRIITSLRTAARGQTAAAGRYRIVVTFAPR